MQEKVTRASQEAAKVRKQKQRVALEAHAASYGVTRGRKLGQGDPVAANSITADAPASGAAEGPSPPSTSTATAKTSSTSTASSTPLAASPAGSTRASGFGLEFGAVEQNNPVNPRGYR